MLIVQVSGEHHHPTINSSDRVTIDCAARLHASASSFCSYICMHVREHVTSEHANLAGIPNDRCSRARLRMRCVVALYRPMPGTSLGLSYKLDKQVNSDRSTIDRAARTCMSGFAFTRMPSCVYDPTPTPPSRTPAKEKTFVGKNNNLAGVPDNRCNSSARIRMACLIVPSWPCWVPVFR